jgi:hypothetical protein
MPVIVKETNGNHEEYHLNPAALFMIMHMGEMNGWTHRGEDPDVFSEEVSEDLCAALEDAAYEIEESLLPIEDESEDICNNCFLMELVKRNQIELIDEFLGFCQGEAFRVNFEN